MPTPAPGFFDKLKSAWISVVALLGVITTVIGGIDLVRDRGSLVAVVLLALGLAVLIAWLGYVILARTRLTSGFAPRRWRYGATQRIWAMVGLAAMVVGGVGIAGRVVFLRSQPPTQTIILLADFEGPDPMRYRVTETVFSRLEEITKSDPTIRAQRLGEPISQHEGSVRARALGEKHRAAIVIWGFYGATEQKVPISVKFELMDDPFQEEVLYTGWGSSEALGTTSRLPGAADLGIAGNPVRERSDLESFALQTDLSQSLSAAVIFIRGFTHYRTRDWASAIADFSTALELAEGPEQSATRAEILIWRGKAHDYLQQLDAAMADFSHCLELTPGNVRALINRSNIHSQLTAYDAAARDLDAAIEGDPDSWIAFFNRAAIRNLQGKPGLAATDLEHALALQPTDLTSLQALYFVHLELGRSAQATLVLERMQHAHSDSWQTHIVSAYEALMIEDYAACDAAIRRAVDLEPDSALVRVWAASMFSDTAEASDRALALLDEALAIDPQDEFARFRRGRRLSRRNEFEAAHRDLVIVAQSEDAPAEVFLELGSVAVALARTEEATRAYERALEIVPRAFGAWLGLAQIDMAAERWEQAIAKLTTGLEFWPESDLMLIERINAFIQTDALDRALDDGKRLLALDESNPLAAELMARALVLTDRFDEADEYYALAVEGSANPARINYRRATNLSLLKKHDEAEKAFAAAAEAFREDATFLVRRAANSIGAGRHMEAVSQLDAALALAPAEVATRLDIAYEFGRLEAYERAIEIESQVIEDAPNTALAWKRRAMHLWMLNNNEAALADARHVLEMTPADADAYKLLGHIAMSADEFSTALTAYTKALELNPSESHLLIERAEATAKLGDSTAALADLSAAIEADPSSTDALLKRVELHIMENRLEPALEDINRAIDLGAGSAGVFTYQGGLHLELGHAEEALASFQRALDIQPDHLPAIRMRIDALLRSERLAEARRALEAATTAHPDLPEFRFQLGQLYARDGDWAMAAKFLADAATAAPVAPDVLNEAAYALYRSGDPAAGLELADRAVAAAPDRIEFLDTFGHILRETGRLEEALDAFNRALSGEQVFAESIVGRAKTLLALEREGEAREDLRAAIEREPDGPFAEEARRLLGPIAPPEP